MSGQEELSLVYAEIGGRMGGQRQSKDNSNSDILNCFHTMSCAKHKLWQQSSVNEIWL